MLAFAAVKIFEDFVGYFQPLEVNDADVFIAVFPDLALLEFQRHDSRKSVSPNCPPERRKKPYFFLPAACLLATAARFLAAAALDLDAF